MKTSLTFGTHSLKQSWRLKVQQLYAVLKQFLCYKRTGRAIPESYSMWLIHRSCFSVRKARAYTNLLPLICEPGLLMSIDAFVLSFAVSRL